MPRILTLSWIPLLFVSFSLGCASSSSLKQQSPFAGTWNYHVTDPTGEAYAGVLVIAEQNGILTGSISNEVLSVDRAISQVSLSEGQLAFAFEAGSYGEIEVNVSAEGDNLSGIFTNQAIGEMPLKGIRVSGEVVSTSVASSEPKISSDPSAARVRTSDITHFWEAFDKAEPDFAPEVFQELYLDRGSDGVKGFMRYRIQNASHLAETVSKNQERYKSVRDKSLNLPDLEPVIQEDFRTFKELYPDAVFPDVYMVIGALNSGGTASANALIVGVEMFADTDMQLQYIVAHELIHFQQKYPANTLLEQTIKEGSADFIGELISGKTANEQLPAYAEPIEEELWNEFKAIMDGEDFKGWLYGDSGVEGRPNDVGYWMGYKITEAYYNQVEDKKQAIKDILNLTDATAFLEASGYGKQFIAKP